MIKNQNYQLILQLHVQAFMQRNNNTKNNDNNNNNSNNNNKIEEIIIQKIVNGSKVIKIVDEQFGYNFIIIFNVYYKPENSSKNNNNNNNNVTVNANYIMVNPTQKQHQQNSNRRIK